MSHLRADERARQSKARLTLKWGPLLQRWATLRRAHWGIGERWAVDDLLALVGRMRREPMWRPLGGDVDALSELDGVVRMYAGCFHLEPRVTSPGRTFSTAEITALLVQQHQELKPERARYLLAREARRGRLLRSTRGEYRALPHDWQWLEFDERQARLEDDAYYTRWRERSETEKGRCADVLLAHYLLPHLKTYRKLRPLRMSERSYYYRLAAALDHINFVAPGHRAARRSRRKSVQR